ncbi:MAG TPA: hypothetical protein VFV75_18815 [Candidatus Polarisedimenticolaceae bacterium]|nr:hypothetical protein [Candidatus Polarisedimenticolaceae bacterium]
MPEPYDPGTAKALIRRLITGGLVTFGTHALKEMGKDNLCRSDVLNVLRAGAVAVNQLVGDHWRYTVETWQICTVILFRGEAPDTVTEAPRGAAKRGKATAPGSEPEDKREIRVVTAWRKRP